MYIDAENQGLKILLVKNDAEYFDLIAQKLILKKAFGVCMLYPVILLNVFLSCVKLLVLIRVKSFHMQ